MSDEDVELKLPDTLNEWQGKHATIFADTTEELEIEGARACAKTTLLLDKEIAYLRDYPGIHSFMCRYSDTATSTKLKPHFEAICKIRGFNDYRFDAKELCYNFTNDSKMYAFGVKAATAVARYEKIRGQAVSRVYNDQSEEMPKDLGEELRASLRQKRFPNQITFSPNPVARNHWLANKRHGGFPLDNSMPGRRRYGLSIYDNAYNLAPGVIERMVRTYPPDHAKHAAMILGERGPNVVGDAVFEKTFRRALHVRPITLNRDVELFESFEFGKHNPCVAFGQRLSAGGLVLLGGIMGEDLFLEDFLPKVKAYRAEWFGHHEHAIKACCTGPGANIAANGAKFTNLRILQQAGIQPRYRVGANSPDVQLALIEQLASYQRRRNLKGDESFGINSHPARWITVTPDGDEQDPWMAHAFEANFVWDEHLVSVENQTMRQAHEDDWFANAVHCVQNIEINFCTNQPTIEELEQRRAAQRTQDSDNASRYGSTWGWS